ncbi:MAG: hypothetical protein H6840_02865 [Planctomycetes bacterium]|nr:hypothetical protein [Planctomycetota bacterium]
MTGKFLIWFGVMALFCGVLAAQQDIIVQYPVGTTVAHGSSIDLGDHPDKAPYNLTIRIQNIGTGTNLVLDTSATNRPCDGGGAVQCNWFITQPATTTLAPSASVDFTMDITPNAKGKWEVWLDVYSDDPDTPKYSVRFFGTAGKEKKDEKCSTAEGSGLSLLALLGVVCALAAGVRLRGSRG